jgi:transcription factor-like protein
VHQIPQNMPLYADCDQKKASQTTRVRLSPWPCDMYLYLTHRSFRYIAQLEQRLSEVEGVLNLQEKSLGMATVPDSSSRAKQTTTPVLNNDTSLITLPGDSNPWMSMPESQVPFDPQADGQGYDLGFSFEAPGQGEPDFSTLADYVDDHLTGSASSHLTPESYASSPLSTRQPLPTKTAALELVNETFVNYNRFLPLFDEEDFFGEFHLKYSTSTPRDPGWWACLNVVLSIAHRLRALRTLDPTRENVLAFGHIQNALGVVSELSISEHSLSAVQALVGMACILQGTPNPAPAAMLVAAALRLAQTMNLHRECPGPPLTMPQLEKRRRVFWKAYILDKDISLRTGRPFTQDDDDMDVLLPSKPGPEPCDVDIFNLRIRLAVIQGLVYKQLYSIRAERQTETQRALAAHELSLLLSHWKSNANLDLPSGSSVSSGPPMSGEVIHKVVLRLTYIHCLAMIDRHLDHQSPSPSYQDLDQGGLSLSQASLCLTESRKAIRLIESIPHGDCSCIW